MALRLNDPVNVSDAEATRAPAPIIGWTLGPLMRLDRAGARGLISDLTVAGPLTRQGAFILAAAILERGEAAIDALIAPFDLVETGADAAGVVLRRQRTREVIAAVYGVRPTMVPGGYLRALQRIQEARSGTPGLDPLAEPDAYKRMFEILSSQKHSPAAHGLRYCGPLRAMHVRAVDELHPLLVVPEVLRTMYGTDKIRQANNLLALLRQCVTTLDEAALTTALRQSLGHGDALGRLGQRILEQADRLPVPDLPYLDGLRILATADEIRAFGIEMSNCAGQYVCEVALGMKLLGAYTHVDRSGETTPLAIVLTPMVSGAWEVEQILGRDNGPVPRRVLRSVLRRLMSIGIQVSGPTPSSTYDRDVAELLGFHRFHRSCESLREAVAGDDEDDLPDPAQDGVVVALRRAAEFA